jgi:hypothetical protein
VRILNPQLDIINTELCPLIRIMPINKTAMCAGESDSGRSWCLYASVVQDGNPEFPLLVIFEHADIDVVGSVHARIVAGISNHVAFLDLSKAATFEPDDEGIAYASAFLSATRYERDGLPSPAPAAPAEVFWGLSWEQVSGDEWHGRDEDGFLLGLVKQLDGTAELKLYAREDGEMLSTTQHADVVTAQKHADEQTGHGEPKG